MTVIALLFGSVLGFFAALTGWLFWDASFASAVGIYLGTAFGTVLFGAMTMLQTSAPQDVVSEAQVA